MLLEEEEEEVLGPVPAKTESDRAEKASANAVKRFAVSCFFQVDETPIPMDKKKGKKDHRICSSVKVFFTFERAQHHLHFLATAPPGASLHYLI